MLMKHGRLTTRYLMLCILNTLLFIMHYFDRYDASFCSLGFITLLAFFCVSYPSFSLSVPSFLFVFFLFPVYSFIVMIYILILLLACRFPVTVLPGLCPFFITGAEGWRVSARLIAPSQSLPLMALPGWRSFSCDSQIALPS